MAAMMGADAGLAAKFAAIFPHLDERQRRLLMGAEARTLGHGGVRKVARAAGAREATVSAGVAELESGQAPLGRVRRAGGGRKRLIATDPGLRPALLALVEPTERGDPISPLRWTTKSTRKLADELTRAGHKVGADTVADLLREEGFSLQVNAKTLEGSSHPDRDARFRYLNTQAEEHLDAAQPVISVDTKKKELVGAYKNGGGEWRPKGVPVQVKPHDFVDPQVGKAIPYGIYDIGANTGWVSVGTDHDTAAFAVASIRRWWQARGRHDYPHAHRLLITADAGGSNGYRTRAWKTELATLAAETGLAITVCHLPPGTSKWNKIEHRLFSAITLNWRGRPLTSHETIVNTIAATTTGTGLRVEAELDTDTYDTGVKITDAQLDALPMRRHRFHGDWNYTVDSAPPAPAPDVAEPAAAGPASPAAQPLDTTWLRDPELTGMSGEQLTNLIDELTPALAHRREQSRQARRGRQRHRAAGAGAKDRLSAADRVLATVLCLRRLGTHELMAELFGVTRSTLTRTVQDVQPLLAERDHAISPSTARFRTPADVRAFLAPEAAQPEIKPAS
jgi:hypothetical protein